MPVPAAVALGAKAVPWILKGISALGGIFGKKRKHVDPETLRAMFGPRAVSKEVMELTNYIINSPAGQKMMAQAEESGQNFQTEMAARAAESGMSPDSGGQSGASDFAVASGTQAGAAFGRDVKAGITQQAMPIAQQMVDARMRAYLDDLQGGGYQDPRAAMWEHVGNAAGSAAAMIPAQAPRETVAASNNPADPGFVGPPAPAALSAAPVTATIAPQAQAAPVTPTAATQAMSPAMLAMARRRGSRAYTAMRRPTAVQPSYRNAMA